MMNEGKANINMGSERKGIGTNVRTEVVTDAHNTVQRARMRDECGKGTDAHKGPHPPSTPPPSLLYDDDASARPASIVGTGAGWTGGGAPCGRPSSPGDLPYLNGIAGDHEGSRCIRLFACLCIIIVLLSLYTLSVPLTTHAATVGKGRISGQLLDGSKKNATLAGQSVTLQMAQNSTAQDLSSVKTDGHGDFSFPNLDTSKGVSYSVYILYQGAQYNTKLIDLSTKAVQQVNLTVYDATTSTTKIAVLAATILLHAPNAQKGMVTVSELYVFNNLDNHTYVGSLNASAGMPNALRFSLPHTASNVSLSTGFAGYQSVQVAGGFASNAAVLPGISQFAFTFAMPYSQSSYDFDYLVVYPTVQLSLYVPPDIHTGSDTLASQGIVTADQQPYQLLHATTLRSGKEVHAQLEGLPTALPNVSPSSTGSTNTLWLIAALIAMAIVVLLTWSIYRSRRRAALVLATKSNGKAQARPVQRVQREKRMPGEQPAAKSANNAKTRSVVAEKTEQAEKGTSEQQEALLQALLDLDTAYEAGKLSKSVYQARRAKTKAKLRSLMASETAKK